MSIIHKASAAFTDATLPRLTRDPLIGLGSLFRLDFTDDYTLNGLAAGAPLADNTVLKNITDGQSDATASGIALATVAAGKLGISNTARSTNTAIRLNFPLGAYDMHDTGDHSFILHFWAKQDAASSGDFDSYFGARSGTTNAADVTSPIWGTTAAPAFLNMNASATMTPSAFQRAGGNAPALLFGANAMVGAANLLSFSYSAGIIRAFRNGVQVVTAVAPASTVPSMRSHATITAAGNVAANDTVTVNGTVITFVAAAPVGAQVLIGADGAASLANLKTYINANKATLNARAEQTLGQAATVLTVLHTGSAVLTLAKSAASLTLSAITNPYSWALLPRALVGTIYAIAMNDLTVSGETAAANAAAEYAGFKARLQGKGVTVA